MQRKLTFALMCLLSLISTRALADATTLASWTFDKAYDTSTVGDVTYYTPNTSDAADVTGWFNKSVVPNLRPNTYVGTQTDYNLTAMSSTRYWQLCTGYQNRVLRIENSNAANNITDFTDASQHDVYYEISFPTLSYKDIQVNFAYSYGANANAPMEIVVSTDGGKTWTDAGYKGCATGWWIYNDNNISISAQNKEKVIVRLIATNGYASNWNLLYINVTGQYSTDFKKQYTLTAKPNIAGAGTITASPSGSEFDEGTEVTVSTMPNFGYRFVNWTDADGNIIGTGRALTLTMDQARTAIANYETVKTYELTYSIEGIQSNHLVTVAPSPTVVDGKNMYEEGTQVVLTASDNDVVSFLSWDNGVSTSKTYTITMTSNRSVVATYNNKNYIVAWDFVVQEPKRDRVADYYANADNQGMMMLTNDGTTSYGWLSHTGWGGFPCAISWQNIADKCYFQWQCATTGRRDISVKLSASAINYSRYDTYNMEYSTDNSSWTILGTYDFTTVTGWQTQTFLLPEACNNQPVVYMRLRPADSATIIGKGNDCLGITNLFITYTPTADATDTTAPTLLSSLPAQNATGISTSGSIILTFDEDIFAADGAYGELNGEKITPTISGKTAIFAYSALTNSSENTFLLAANSLKDASGNAYAEPINLLFTTIARTQPSARLYDAVVAADGSGDYKTVIEAIEKAPANRATPWLIFVKEGTYTGHIDIPQTKPYIHIIGEDRNLVNIEGKRLCGNLDDIKPSSTDVYELKSDGTCFSVDAGATVYCKAKNTYFEGVNLVNSYGRDEKNGPQALALYADNDRFILNKCGLISFQDTYLSAYSNASDRQYIRNTWIEGAVDFIYGAGDVFFDHDTINVVRQKGGYIVAPSHSSATKWGYVFDHTVITSNIVDDPKETQVYFGRPWTNQPVTVFLHTECQVSTFDGIWYPKMGGLPSLWAVYDMWDKDGNQMSTVSRSDYVTRDGVTGTAKNSLTDEEAANYTLAHVMRGSDAWQPELICEPTAAPVISSTGAQLTWDAVPYAICYVILKDGRALDFTTGTSYNITSNGQYSVKAASEYGALSDASNAIECTTGIQNVNVAAPADDRAYSITGQRISRNAKGLVIINGKKYINK